MQQISLCFIVVVWGENYVDMLLQVSLRCFLSPQNIPGLASLSSSKFVLVTTKQDYQTISQSRIYKRLTDYIEPVFIELDEDSDSNENVYTKVTMGYEQATKYACEHQAYAIYLLPDCVISNGTICSLEKYAFEGRDVVLLPGPRVIKDRVMSYVSDLRLEDGDALSFEPRKLVSIGLDFLHSEFKNYNYTGQRFTKWPHMVTWSIPEQNGLLVRAFHLHPLMVNFSKQKGPVDFNKYDTIDGSFIKRNFLDFNKFLLETDSDNMILYSMTEEKDRVEEGLVWGTGEKLRAILDISQREAMVNELQKIYFYNAYKLHSEELGATWDDVERESLSVVKAVLTSTKISRNQFTLYLKTRKRVMDALPPQLRLVLKRMYWKTKEMIGWLKSKLIAT